MSVCVTCECVAGWHTEAQEGEGGDPAICLWIQEAQDKQST